MQRGKGMQREGMIGSMGSIVLPFGIKSGAASFASRLFAYTGSVSGSGCIFSGRYEDVLGQVRA